MSETQTIRASETLSLVCRGNSIHRNTAMAFAFWNVFNDERILFTHEF